MPLVSRAVLGLVLVSLLALGACGASEGRDGTDSTPVASDEAVVSGPITVLAAASLTEVFESLGEAFEQAHPGAYVTFSFAGSSALATQIEQGAPADVFASASEATMDLVVEAGAVLEPVTFATNSMQIVVPVDNPAGVSGLADLARTDVRVALCQQDVPCGVTARRVLSSAGVAVTPVTLESDVRATLVKVELGEVDAAIVYRTDALAAGDSVLAIPVPDDVNDSTAYPIAVVSGSSRQETAQAFVDFVLSAEGARALADAGFGSP
ncbi:molybdate ABC transporter substrate-binding protein [Actinotalea sp.]|uniref:molybdate ABC transporter substrate-binding protein n=1 Tax=Actinotalea sp. TaxID=1872145 RepID=UPI003569FD56